MDRRIVTLVQFLNDHYEQNLSLSDLARVVNLSPWHTARMFAREIGLPPFRFLHLLRLRRAKCLLESTFLSVKEVMVCVGLQDASHFVRDFQLVYGHSPKEYRRRYLERRLLPSSTTRTARFANE